MSPGPDHRGSAMRAAGEGSVYRQADDYDRGMSPYDPSAFPPFAVTVDLVVLTVRRHALCALVVRRGEPPFQGRWALPGGFVRADEDLAQAAARELAEETGLCAHDPAAPGVRQRRAPRTARHVRRPQARPPDAGRQRRPPRARARPARAPGGRRRQQRPLGTGRGPAAAGRLRPGRRAGGAARLRPRADPGGRGGAGPFQDRVLVAGHGVLPAGVHRRRAAPGVRGGVGRGPRPAQLPPQGDGHARASSCPPGGTTTRQGGRPAQLFRAGGATLLNPPMLRPEV